jgi:predicted patatin/cPLA2 family phospholipase
MTNPLLQKYEELYGKKEEPKPDYYKGEKSYAEELEELRDTSTIPITKLISYDNESLIDGFLQIAEKVKNKEAQVYSMNMDMDYSCRTRRITFEVWDNL